MVGEAVNHSTHFSSNGSPTSGRRRNTRPSNNVLQVVAARSVVTETERKPEVKCSSMPAAVGDSRPPETRTDPHDQAASIPSSAGIEVDTAPAVRRRVRRQTRSPPVIDRRVMSKSVGESSRRKVLHLRHGGGTQVRRQCKHRPGSKVVNQNTSPRRSPIRGQSAGLIEAMPCSKKIPRVQLTPVIAREHRRWSEFARSPSRRTDRLDYSRGRWSGASNHRLDGPNERYAAAGEWRRGETHQPSFRLRKNAGVLFHHVRRSPPKSPESSPVSDSRRCRKRAGQVHRRHAGGGRSADRFVRPESTGPPMGATPAPRSLLALVPLTERRTSSCRSAHRVSTHQDQFTLTRRVAVNTVAHGEHHCVQLTYRFEPRRRLDRVAERCSRHTLRERRAGDPALLARSLFEPPGKCETRNTVTATGDQKGSAGVNSLKTPQRLTSLKPPCAGTKPTKAAASSYQAGLREQHVVPASSVLRRRFTLSVQK